MNAIAGRDSACGSGVVRRHGKRLFMFALRTHKKMPLLAALGTVIRRDNVSAFHLDPALWTSGSNESVTGHKDPPGAS